MGHHPGGSSGAPSLGCIAAPLPRPRRHRRRCENNETFHFFFELSFTVFTISCQMGSLQTAGHPKCKRLCEYKRELLWVEQGWHGDSSGIGVGQEVGQQRLYSFHPDT